MFYRKYLLIFLLSFVICNNTITQVTDIFPSGHPKEVTVYKFDNKLE